MSNSCGFSMVDLKNMLMIIETCQKRGAFNAEEMTGVGALYDKLKKADYAHKKLDNTDDKCCNTEDDSDLCDVSNVGT